MHMLLCMSWTGPKSPFVDMSCAVVFIVTCHEKSTCKYPECFEYTYESTHCSHRAHPVACAVALANLDIIESEELIQNSELVGNYLGQALEDLVNDHDIVASTRGIGLMRQIHLMRDPDSGVSFSAADDLGTKLPRILRAHGLLTRANDVIHVAPPLVTTQPEVDEIIDRLDGVLRALKAEI